MGISVFSIASTSSTVRKRPQTLFPMSIFTPMYGSFSISPLDIASCTYVFMNLWYEAMVVCLIPVECRYVSIFSTFFFVTSAKVLMFPTFLSNATSFMWFLFVLLRISFLSAILFSTQSTKPIPCSSLATIQALNLSKSNGSSFSMRPTMYLSTIRFISSILRFMTIISMHPVTFPDRDQRFFVTFTPVEKYLLTPLNNTSSCTSPSLVLLDTCFRSNTILVVG